VPPDACPFSPKRVLVSKDVVVVLGTDGEVQQLRDDGTPLNLHRPYPIPIVAAGLMEGDLVAAWMDHELRVARLARVDLAEPRRGVERAAVRRDGTMTTHPDGHRWSHALEAEPMAMCVNGDHVALSLWPDGFYVIDSEGREQWRAAVPRGKDGTPRAVVDLQHDGDRWVLTMRDGSRVAMAEDAVTELKPEQVDDPVVLVHHGKGGRLVVTSDHVASWVENDQLVLQATLSGPVGGVLWSNDQDAWLIAGWRERVVLRRDGFNRWSGDEVHADVACIDGVAYSIDNRGQWAAYPT